MAEPMMTMSIMIEHYNYTIRFIVHLIRFRLYIIIYKAYKN